MKSTNHNKMSEQIVSVYKEDINFELAKRLEDEDYALPFDSSKNWHLLRPLATYKTDLSSDHVNFIN